MAGFVAGEFDTQTLLFLAEIPDEEAFAATAKALVPAINSGVERELFETQRVSSLVLRDRLASEDTGVWGQVTLRDSSADTQSLGVSGYDADARVFNLGVDAQVSDSIRIGLLGVYSDLEIDANHSSAGNSDIDSYQVSAYLGYTKGPGFVNAQLGYSFSDIRTCLLYTSPSPRDRG